MIWTEGLKGFLQDTANKRPQVGMRVKVIGGRKHKGKEGIIFWHGVDTYDRSAFRYADSYQAQFRDCAGRYGFRVGVKTDTGEKIFISANYGMFEIVNG